MANVLGELFGDIANAIREKTGDTATMKPAEFPDKIAAIEVGGSSGGSAAIQFKKDRFEVTSPTQGMRISVDIGFKPDYLVVYAINDVKTASGGVTYFGFSSAWSEKFGTDLFTAAHYWISTRTTYNASGIPIDAEYDVMRPISAADATGFNLGRNKPYEGVYHYIAIGLTE